MRSSISLCMLVFVFSISLVVGIWSRLYSQALPADSFRMSLFQHLTEVARFVAKAHNGNPGQLTRQNPPLLTGKQSLLMSGA